MSKTPQEWAQLFGGAVVGEVPDVGGGPFGMARLAHMMHQRLTPSQGERPGRPTDPTWEDRPKVPMSEATQRRLAEMAAQMSSAERRVTAMQLAAQLLETAVAQVTASTIVGMKGATFDQDGLAASEEEDGPAMTEIKTELKTKLRKGRLLTKDAKKKPKERRAR
jgi:hypothetical protein